MPSLTSTCRDENKQWCVLPSSFVLFSPYILLTFLVQTFTCFVFLDLVSAIQNRGLGCGFTQNKMLLTTVSISFVVQLALVYVPVMQSIFQTEALSGFDLCTLFALGAVSATLHEARRRYERSLNATMTFSSAVEELA